MTSCAGFRHKGLLTGQHLNIGGRCGRPALRAEPFVKDARLIGYDEESHMRVLHAAEFRTLPAIDAGAVRRMLNSLGRPGTRSCLPAKAGHPERVNDINTFKLKAHVTSDGDMDFVRGLEPLVRSGAEILAPPPPLQSADFYNEVVTGGHVSGRGWRRNLKRERSDDDDRSSNSHCDRNRHPTLPRRIRTEWQRIAPASAPEGKDQGDHDQGPDERARRYNQHNEVLQAYGRLSVHVNGRLPPAASSQERRR